MKTPFPYLHTAGFFLLLASGVSSVQALNFGIEEESVYSVFNPYSTAGGFTRILDDGAHANWSVSGSTINLDLLASGRRVTSVSDPESADSSWSMNGRHINSHIQVGDIAPTILSDSSDGREGAGGYLRVNFSGSYGLEWAPPEIPEGSVHVYTENIRSITAYTIELYGNAGHNGLVYDANPPPHPYTNTPPQRSYAGFDSIHHPSEGTHQGAFPDLDMGNFRIEGVPVLFDKAVSLDIKATASAAARWAVVGIEDQENQMSYYEDLIGLSESKVNAAFTLELVKYDPTVMFTGQLSLGAAPSRPDITSFSFGEAWNWHELRIPGKIDMVQLTSFGNAVLPAVLDKDREFRGLTARGNKNIIVDLNGHTMTLNRTATSADFSTVGREAILVASGELTLRNGEVEAAGLVDVRNTSSASTLLRIEQGAGVNAEEVFVGSMGNFAGQQADLIVDGHLTQLRTAVLNIGKQGNGSLTVRNGALVSVTDSIVTGFVEGSYGKITVTGEGSALQTFGATEANLGILYDSDFLIDDSAIVRWSDTRVRVGLTDRVGQSSTLFVDNKARSIGGDISIMGNGELRVSNEAYFETSIAYPTSGLSLSGGNAFFETRSTGYLGMLSISDGSRADFSGGAKFTAAGTTVGDTFGGGGRLTLNGAGTEFTVEGNIELKENGQTHVSGGARLTVEELNADKANLSVSTGGRLDFTSGSIKDTRLVVGAGSSMHFGALAVLSGSEVSGHGRFVGNFVNGGGIVAPGSSPGILEIEGNYTQTSGTMVMEIGGHAPGTQFDQLAVTGNFDVQGGTIQFAFINGFAPAAGDVFNLFDVGGSYQNNATFSFSGLETGWEFTTEYNPQTGGFAVTSLNNGVAIIPEPSAWLSCLSGAGLLLLKRRRTC